MKSPYVTVKESAATSTERKRGDTISDAGCSEDGFGQFGGY